MTFDIMIFYKTKSFYNFSNLNHCYSRNPFYIIFFNILSPVDTKLGKVLQAPLLTSMISFPPAIQSLMPGCEVIVVKENHLSQINNYRGIELALKVTWILLLVNL